MKAAFEKNLGPAEIQRADAAFGRQVSGRRQTWSCSASTRARSSRRSGPPSVDGVFGCRGTDPGHTVGCDAAVAVPILNWIGTLCINMVRNAHDASIILFCSFGLSQTLGITLVDSTSLTQSRQQLPAGRARVHHLPRRSCERYARGQYCALGQAEAAQSLVSRSVQNLRIFCCRRHFAR